MDNTPPHAINVTNAVVENGNINQLSLDPSSPSLIQPYPGNQSSPYNLGTQSLNEQNNNQQHFLAEIERKRDEEKHLRYRCFLFQFISFLFGFITEQVTDQQAAIGITTGCISILFGFPIPIIFFNLVLKKSTSTSRVGTQQQNQECNILKRREGFFERQIAALIIFIAAIIAATILLYEAFNESYNVKGMVVVTASLNAFATLLIYVDLVDEEPTV